MSEQDLHNQFQIDKRVKVNTIIENQLPEFVLADFPNAVEFLKQYYISQEFQGGTIDIINNFDRYLKPDNLVPEVIQGETTLPVHHLSPTQITASDTTIEVLNTKGFPDEYGLIKINNEIITYTGKSFTKTDVVTTSGTLEIRFSTTIVGITTTNIAVNDIVKFSSVQDADDTILIPDGTRVTSIGVDRIEVDRIITATHPQETVTTVNPVIGEFTFTHERFFFTGCVRGFSGITGYNVGVSSSLLDVNKESLTFEETSADTHTEGSVVTNLSVLFLQEFFKKLKKTFLPGFENNEFASNLDVGNFIKFSRSFYQSKGIEESIKILFKVLYGVEAKILDLEQNLIKPSSADFIRREVIVADVLNSGEPQNLVGQTIYKSTDLNTNGSVSEVEVFSREGKTYYKIALFVGYSDRDLIEGVFTIPGKTNTLYNSDAGSSVISVDSTVGFGTTGTLISGVNTIDYTSKSINQFFGCTGIGVGIHTADSVRSDEYIFGYEDGDLSKRVDLRITGVLSELVTNEAVKLVNEGETIFVKNIGEKIDTVNSDYKQIFANSWKYNTSSRFQVTGNGPFTTKTNLHESSINIGDTFEILRRNEQSIVGSFNVKEINKLTKLIEVENLVFTPDPFEEYDIRRVIEKSNSSGVSIKDGNDVLISNVLNVYTDSDTFGYVASNSLPSYNLTLDIFKESINGATTSNLDGQDPISSLYSFIRFSPPNNTDIKFIQGDAVIYQPEGEVISGLESGRLYYVDPQPTLPGQNVTTVALYNSRSQIGSASTIQLGIGSATSEHNFILQKHSNEKLSSDQILRKIPLSQNLFIDSKHQTPVKEIGILRDGVQIHSPVSDDRIFFGPLESVEVFNGGDDYDVINPPSIVVEAGAGTTALVEPVISGSVKEVLIDPQDFDIDKVISISLTGGNGSGCLLQPIVGGRFRDLLFDTRNVFFGGGVDINEETITFTQPHNLESGQIVYYRNNGNASLGISTLNNNTITDSLSDGDPYFVRPVNSTTVRIFNTQDDALFGISGINTVGLATDTAASGIHKFRTETKNSLISVKVIDEGSGYQHRKLRVHPSGISTSFDTINFKNHGFNNGEIINYSPTVGLGSTVPKAIQGLSTSTSYFVIKLNDDSFRLADAGIGGTITSNFDRNNYVGLGSTGTGYQTFTYPEIKVNIEVSYGSTVTGDIIATPIVKGSFTDAYLYENGTDYGSKILNHQITPNVSIINGVNAEFRPVINNGIIEDVIVTNQGRNYFSVPQLEVISTGQGKGAILRAVIGDGVVKDVIVINSGIGYSSFTTRVESSNPGKNGLFKPTVRNLTVNNVGRFNDYYLGERISTLSLSSLQYSQNIASNLESSFSTKPNGEFDSITSHSPIIGWSYDGNPIYGPFGYSEPENINSPLKILSSSYKDNSSNVVNRPTGFDAGFFINDYIFDGSGDLDIHNGRFCKTPEFPNGIYAYFTTVKLSSSTNKIEGVYPYYIGESFRFPIITDNYILNHDFDFNNSNLIRNTTPYNAGEEFADCDSILESNESVRQLSTVETVTKGKVEEITILNGGDGYKIGDLTNFDDTDTNGSGFSAEVSDLIGIGVSKIESTLERFNNSVFTWNSNDEVQVNYLPFIELNDQDSVVISGLNTSISNLTNTFKVGVNTDTMTLGKAMPSGVGIGTVEDIFVNKIPNTVSVGGSLRIGIGNTTETLQVLNIFNLNKVIRVFRNVNSAGTGHTFGSNIDILNNRFTIPVKTEKFDSKVDDIIYFNSKTSVGVGTSGVASRQNYVIGETSTVVSIPERVIYLPNHPFKTGQKLTLTRPNIANSEFDVSPTNSASGSFELPFSGQTSTDVYAIKKDENYIGIVTTRVGIGSTSEGLYFLGNGITGIGSDLYNIKSNFTKVIGDVDKVTSTITTKVAAADTTTHGLSEGDIVTLNVVPNLSVGIGTTTPVSVNYNSEFEKLLINSISFAGSNINTVNQLQINNHGLKTGDKVLYEDGGSSATGLNNRSYYVYKVSDNLLQLGLTYTDVISSPPILLSIGYNSGGSNQKLSLINPPITVTNNAKLTFGLSTTTLAGFDFKIFYDKELTNEYISSSDSTNFNVLGIGTIGIGTNNTDPIGAQLSINNSSSTPEVLYYGLSKGGYISTADTTVQNYSEIRFVDSIYNGEYRISGVTSETFNVSPKNPEFLRYEDTECDILEYSTKSKNITGKIKDLKILSSGLNYKRLPKFVNVVSVAGTGANLKVSSTTVGQIDKVRINDFGYEYSSDRTLSPEAFIPPVLNIDNLDQITSVRIVSGGQKYTSPPNLLLFNPISKTVVDNSSLLPTLPNQTITDVEVLAPINGLDSVNHTIVATDNSNGVPIDKIEQSLSGVVTCFLETPFGGFPQEPFAIGDEVYVEGIQRVGEAGIGATGGITTNTTVEGDGFNSENYDYKFFKVDNYIAGTQSRLMFSLSGVTTNPGIAKTFQSGFANLINRKDYPEIVPIQKRGQFELQEKLSVNNIRTDLIIVDIRDDYVKVDGLYLIRKGDRITGNISGVSAEITSISENKGKYKISFSNRQEVGWLNDIGKINEDYMVISDNNYYQNLSYTVKSSIEWDKFVNSVNRLVHPSGLKNFADTSIQSTVSTRTGLGKTVDAVSSIVLDVVSDQMRVDAVNNFDVAKDFNVISNKTKNIQFTNKELSDFSRCSTNRVLIHDDISGEFSSAGFTANNSILEELTEDIGNYIIQIVDPDTLDTQLHEVVVITDEDDVILFEKTKDFTTLDLGSIETEITSSQIKNLLFNPTEKLTKDHDIKVLKTDFNTTLVGINTNSLGNISLTGVNVGVNSATSGVGIATIVEYSKTNFNGLYASIFVEDTITKHVNYNEVIIDFDGTDTTISQTYVDKKGGSSLSSVGIITAKFENNLIKLQIENDRVNDLEVRANVVGLGTTTSGISTFRFSGSDQPAGSERSGRLESGYVSVTGAASTTYNTISDVDGSVKSLIRVSSGNTSAIHQIISLRDNDDILTIQYPFVSAGSTSGIGTFGGEIVGSDINLKFYPDPQFTSLIEIQSYNEILNIASDFDNTPPDLNYGTVTKKIFLKSYNGKAGKRADKVKFLLQHEGTPIYTKTFNPSTASILNTSTGQFTIPNHFFSNNEELVYKPDSSFIGVAGTAMQTTPGTDLPSKVFCILIDENNFKLSATRGGTPLTFVSTGGGNSHKLSMAKSLSKTIIGLDGVVQQPVSFTSINHTLDSNIGVGLTQFVLSGISSIQPSDLLKINDEFMTVTQVGFASVSDGLINDAEDVAAGIATLPVVKVERGVLGNPATTHSANDVARLHRGSFNIVDSFVHFIAPPKGNTAQARGAGNLPFVKANFSGRTFLRQNYTTNMLFDDISDDFTGIGKTYSLTVGGANTSSGIGVGNGVLFINGVFQTPRTTNNSGHNYEFLADTTAGISTVEFTGITSENGQFIVSEQDINQNQVPRGGLIVSLGSTPGLGYAPLVGAKASLFKNAAGAITSVVGIATTSGVNYGISTAAYDNITGIITVTTDKVHGFSLGQPNTVQLKGLEFVCPKTIVGTVTNATYNTANGNFVITIANHGLVNGDAVILTTESFGFTCTQDGNTAVKLYPRATDPAANQYLTVSNVTTNTFRVNVGASSPSDQYAHTFVSADADAVKTIGGGGYVGVTTTIFQDHDRPLFLVGIVSERTFEVQAGASTIPHTYQGGGVAYEFFEDNTFGSGYRGGTVAIGVTDLAYEHRFVSAGIGSIRRTTFNGAQYTATNAVYESHSGLLTLTIPNHNLTTSNTVGIDTGGLVFKCSKDGFFGNHPYPRGLSITSNPNGDPIAGIQTAIRETTSNTITIFVGQGGGGGTGADITATVGVGGTLAFNIVSAGTSYVNPRLLIPEPTYENLPVIGVSRLGIGATTDTGSNLLLNVEVSSATTSVGIGSTLFKINDFSVARDGHSFKVGDKFKPVGLVTASHLTSPLNEFELEVVEIFRDTFSSWQFGEIDFIDSIENLQNGVDRRFPLFFNGQLLSFEKDPTDPVSVLIDLDAVLLIFVNGVLQSPKESYTFEGGSTFTFAEAPDPEDKVDIFFYKGEEGVDVEIIDVQESVKIGDQLRLLKNDTIGFTTTQSRNRSVKEILSADLVETDIYNDIGIDPVNPKPIRWEKQKRDVILNGRKITKTRSVLEPQIYPTAKIIGDLTSTSGQDDGSGVNGIFVDDASSFFYEKEKYGQSGDDEVDALITGRDIDVVSAAATALVSSAGTITGFDITEAGSGYTSATVRVGSPIVGLHTFIQSDGTVGIATTATATATITNGSLSAITLTNPGLGYSNVAPPEVIISLPTFQTEKINTITNAQGFTGIITGIKTETRTGGLSLRFYFNAVNEDPDGDMVPAQAVDLRQNYPVLITDTTIGSGLTSVQNQDDNSVVGIGTTFLDNIYIVRERVNGGTSGEILCDVHSNSSSAITNIGIEDVASSNSGIVGFNSTGMEGLTVPLGKINWGRLYGASLVRSSNPISIGVTGLTVDAGLSTFPTIQRKNYAKTSLRGLRSSGAIRVFGL